VVEYSIQLLSVNVKLILTVRLEAYSVSFSYPLGKEVVIRIDHSTHKRLMGEWLLDI
jgi:hypothetical protein